MDLYRGPFLAGFSLPASPEFEAWALLESSAPRRCYRETLAALVEDHTARRDYRAAIDYARRYLAVDDLNEGMHRHLIELYAAIDDRGAAMRQFEQCTLTLERELGISPLPETRAAYKNEKSMFYSLARRPGRAVREENMAHLPETWRIEISSEA
ncbi:MAG: hypothetical protein Kow0063_44610 [Anaerolineae bacterium]